MTPDQARAARKLLSWSIVRLSAMSSVSIPDITRFEFGADVSSEVRAAIRAALEDVGVEFTDGDASGVKLRRAPA